MNGRIVLTVLFVLVVVAAVLGIAGYAFNLGLTQGMASTGKLEVPITASVPYPYYYPPFGMHMFGGFGFLSCLVPLIVLCVLFSVMRMVFWRARWGGMHHRKWEGGIPPMAEEWHRKMHEQQPATQK